ncbi:hypothetical protein HYALB_00005348 [Hymenoscyphus albidus]|uniref:Uncharacterized protein n=1 Tax=Hymenoscyphus albidus TaxID=595503 RepID=A0A9N9M199_9HELO|nr:hypothetical protein HYALB_00005348 [Hymenoscyphus albidus]
MDFPAQGRRRDPQYNINNAIKERQNHEPTPTPTHTPARTNLWCPCSPQRTRSPERTRFLTSPAPSTSRSRPPERTPCTNSTLSTSISRPPERTPCTTSSTSSNSRSPSPTRTVFVAPLQTAVQSVVTVFVTPSLQPIPPVATQTSTPSISTPSVIPTSRILTPPGVVLAAVTGVLAGIAVLVNMGIIIWRRRKNQTRRKEEVCNQSYSSEEKMSVNVMKEQRETTETGNSRPWDANLYNTLYRLEGKPSLR